MGLIEHLLNLHRVDSQVRGLRKRLESAERYLSAQNRQCDAVQQQLEEQQSRKRHVQASIANLETEVAAMDAQLEKFREDLNRSVTNKQYTAVLSEMNTVKGSRTELEERELQLMEQAESHDEQIAQLEVQLAERTKVRDVAATQLKDRQAEVGQRLEELEQERMEAAAVVPGGELATFNEIAERYEGEAMAPIDEINRRHREYTCGACHMRITYEQVAGAVGGADVLIRCTACDRILYMQDELRGVLTPK